MPTYEYACDNCQHQFERVQRITEDPIKKCPQCGKHKARRLITGGNFILKGGGWESDLYSGASNRPATSSKESSSESTNTPAASDAKPSPSSDKKSEKTKKTSSSSD